MAMYVLTWLIWHHATASYVDRLPLCLLRRRLNSRHKRQLSVFIRKN